MTADDITYSYGLYLNRDANSPRYNTAYSVVETVTAVDDRAIRFKLRLPTASFLTEVATFGIVPQHSLVNTQPADLATSDFGTTSNIVGTGPFRMTRWLRSERMEAEADPTYHLGKVASPNYTLHRPAHRRRGARRPRDGQGGLRPRLSLRAERDWLARRASRCRRTTPTT